MASSVLIILGQKKLVLLGARSLWLFWKRSFQIWKKIMTKTAAVWISIKNLIFFLYDEKGHCLKFQGWSVYEGPNDLKNDWFRKSQKLEKWMRWKLKNKFTLANFSIIMNNNPLPYAEFFLLSLILLQYNQYSFLQFTARGDFPRSIINAIHTTNQWRWRWRVSEQDFWILESLYLRALSTNF